VEIVASLSQGRTAAAQCGLFTHKSVPVMFEPPCICTYSCIIVHCFVCLILTNIGMGIKIFDKLSVQQILSCYMWRGGLGSVVGTATAYGLDGPGIESWWGEIFHTSPDRP